MEPFLPAPPPLRVPAPPSLGPGSSRGDMEPGEAETRQPHSSVAPGERGAGGDVQQRLLQQKQGEIASSFPWLCKCSFWSNRGM